MTAPAPSHPPALDHAIAYAQPDLIATLLLEQLRGDTKQPPARSARRQGASRDRR